MYSIFTVTKEDLARLSAEEAVDRFRDLLWAEATTLGIGKNLINVSTAITVSDGGVDAVVRDAPAKSGQGIIKLGLTCYQIKTGDYALSNRANIRKILFTPRSKGKELEPKVKSCLDNGGTLVVVLFGWDIPGNKAIEEYTNSFREQLRIFDKQYTNAQIEVWLPNLLIGFFNTFPSLALKVRGLENALFQSHRSWSLNDDMQRSFERGAAQDELISSLQTALRQSNGAIHVHVRGEAGIGKTRCVLEAISTDDLAPLVIYCNDASKFNDSNLMHAFLREDDASSAILVLDECDPETRRSIWNRLKHRGSRIKLITIHNEFDFVSSDIACFDTPPLGQDKVSSIIQGYGTSEYDANHYAELCNGSPRVAHIIGMNLKNNPRDPLGSMDDIWDRFIVGSEHHNSESVPQRFVILRHLALFMKFGYGRQFSLEAKAIVKIIQRVSNRTDQATFDETIDYLKNRKILQGQSTLYITPKALHIKLWGDWWRIYGQRFNFDEFLEDLSSTPQLLQWFFDMFKYAAQSEVATAIVEEILGENGPFQLQELLQIQLGARFFLALTEANPAAALRCLKRTIGTWGKETLLEFTTGRREIIYSLERIAMWRPLFADAARLILSLAEAENETWANNASGVFAELFSLGTGELAPTQAPPQERFTVLREALQSLSERRRLLAISACDKALESRFFSRDVGAEYQGLRRVPDLWMPKTYGELFDAYREIWYLLQDQLKTSSSDEQQAIINILLRRAREISRFVALSDMVINTVDTLAEKAYTDKKKILADIVSILHYDGKRLPEKTRKRWEELEAKLSGTDFSSQLKRYVGMDLLADKFDPQGNQADQAQSHIEELVQQVIDDPGLLRLELHWLVTREAQNGYKFGYELGKRDAAFTLLPMLLEAQRNATNNPNVFFLSGYLRVLFEKDQQRWEEQADILAEDEYLRIWLPDLTWQPMLSDRGALRLLKLIEEGAIDVARLRYFSAGRAIQSLSEGIFQRLIQTLLSSSHPLATPIALDLYHTYYVDSESKHILPEQPTLILLTQPTWIQPPENLQLDSMDYYHWREVGRAFVDTHPEKDITLAEWMIEYFGERGTILDGLSETEAVLYSIAQQHPLEVWTLITKYLGPPLDRRAFHLRNWLQGALPVFPLEQIWQWVDEDTERRASYLAGFVPKSLIKQEEQVSLAREVLMRYGEREDVRQAFSANYFSGTWWGSESAHYESERQNLLDLKPQEDNSNVKRWIDEYVNELNGYIGDAKMREERNTF